MANSGSYPLVSIIIATYNGGLFLSGQIDSILNQTYPNIEVIVTDDGSCDDTLSILDKYASAIHNFKYFKNENRLGYVKNFEKGCTFASGNYFAFCDQDDIWDHDKISILMNEINGYDLIYSDSELIDEKGNSLHKKVSDLLNFKSYDNCLYFATDNCIPGHAAIITRRLFEKAFPFVPDIHHDWWLSYLASFNGGIKFINMPLVKWRQHQTNTVGVIKISRKIKTKKSVEQKRNERKIDTITRKSRMMLFYNACPENLVREKNILEHLATSYQNFSFANNLKRVLLFLTHKEYFLAIKKRNGFRKFLFCLKMFFRIR